MSIQVRPGSNAVTQVCTQIEAQIARVDERGINARQRPMMEGQAVIDQKRKRESQGLLD